MKLLPLLPLLLALTAACASESSPTQPDAPPPPEPTRVIRLGGNLNFGPVAVGTILDGVLTVSNDGNDILDVTRISLTTNQPLNNEGCLFLLFPLSPVTFVVPPGQTVNVDFRFAPASNVNCGGRFSVFGNQTSGTNTIFVIASGFFR